MFIAQQNFILLVSRVYIQLPTLWKWKMWRLMVAISRPDRCNVLALAHAPLRDVAGIMIVNYDAITR